MSSFLAASPAADARNLVALTRSKGLSVLLLPTTQKFLDCSPHSILTQCAWRHGIFHVGTADLDNQALADYISQPDIHLRVLALHPPNHILWPLGPTSPLSVPLPGYTCLVFLSLSQPTSPTGEYGRDIGLFLWMERGDTRASQWTGFHCIGSWLLGLDNRTRHPGRISLSHCGHNRSPHFRTLHSTPSCRLTFFCPPLA